MCRISWQLFRVNEHLAQVVWLHVLERLLCQTAVEVCGFVFCTPAICIWYLRISTLICTLFSVQSEMCLFRTTAALTWFHKNCQCVSLVQFHNMIFPLFYCFYFNINVQFLHMGNESFDKKRKNMFFDKLYRKCQFIALISCCGSNPNVHMWTLLNYSVKVNMT